MNFGRRSEGKCVLLAPCPNEQHTFGRVMVSEFFRLAGWGGAEDAATVAGSTWFDVVGFSLGAQGHIKALTREIAAVRRAACNRRIAVISGGLIFAERPDLVQQVRADAVATDGQAAPALVEHLAARLAVMRNSANGMAATG